MKLGARIVKTGVSVTVALTLATWLGMDVIVFAAIAAVLTIQPSVYRSLTYIKDVSISNLIGALFALGMMMVLGNNPLVIGLTVILIIGANLALKLNQSVNLSVLTAIAIMETMVPGPAWLFAGERFLTIMIGVGSSLLLNMFFLPPKHGERLFSTLTAWHEKLTFLLRHLHHSPFTPAAIRDEHAWLKKTETQAASLFALHDEERKGWKLLRSRPRLRHLVIYRQMIKILTIQTKLYRTLSTHYPEVEYSSPKAGEEILSFLESIIRYQEFLFLSYEDKVRTDQGETHDEALSLERKTIHELMRLYSPEHESLWPHLFPITHSFIEATTELERLERLIARKK